MQIKIVLSIGDIEKPDIRDFVRMIREWELRTPSGEVVGIDFKTDPEISDEEAREIFQGLFPEFDPGVTLPTGAPSFIRLGRRGVTADGKLVGTCDELSLSFGAVGPEELEALENANTIGLVRMGKG